MSPSAKRCGRCFRLKPLTDFNRRLSRGPLSFQSYCRECDASANRKIRDRLRKATRAVKP